MATNEEVFESVSCGSESNGEQVEEPKKGSCKKCGSCGILVPNACKKCKNCGQDIKVKTFDWEKLKGKKKTHPTQQRKIMESRANILNYQHGWHIVILAYNQHSRGTSVYAYGTPGVGESFVGTEKSEASKEGRLFINVFKKYAANQISSNKPSDCQQTTEVAASANDNDLISVNTSDDDQKMTSPNDEHIPGMLSIGSGLMESGSVGHGADGSVIGFSGSVCETRIGDGVLSENSSISSGQAVSVDAGSGQTAESRPLERGNGSQGAGPVANVDVATTNVTNSQGSEKGARSRTMTGNNAVKRRATKRGANEADVNETCRRVEIGSTEKVACVAIGNESEARKKETAVAYVIGKEILAVGNVNPDRRVLHGHTIKAGFSCVMLTFVKSPNIAAPLVLGDPEENAFLRKGMFFVFPDANLFTFKDYVAGQKVVLRQFIP